jgi:hypothetical protein
MKKLILPVHIDGLLYALMAMGTAFLTAMATPAAREFVPPVVLFWMQVAGTVVTAGAINLKAYRSRTYADSRTPLGVPASAGQGPKLIIGQSVPDGTPPFPPFETATVPDPKQ